MSIPTKQKSEINMSDSEYEPFDPKLSALTALVKKKTRKLLVIMVVTRKFSRGEPLSRGGEPLCEHHLLG